MNPKAGDTLSVLLVGGLTDLQVEDYHPLEPSNYVLDPGWTCFDLNTDTEYFVNRSGDVFAQPENRVVGVCPALAAQYEEILEDHFIEG